MLGGRPALNFASGSPIFVSSYGMMNGPISPTTTMKRNSADPRRAIR